MIKSLAKCRVRELEKARLGKRIDGHFAGTDHL